jgi:hypothetical protein
MRAAMARLATCLSLALVLLPPSALPRLTGQAIRGRRFGGSVGVLLAESELPLQVVDLFLGVVDLFGVVVDLLLLLGEFLVLLLNLSL